MKETVPGSSVWLLRYELIQYVRQSQKNGVKAKAIFSGIILAILLFVGLPLALDLRHASFSASVPLILLLDVIATLLFTLMLSQGLMQATSAFYERGDLDLLLSSPLPPTRILRIRWLGIALVVAGVFLFIVTPFVLPIMLLDHWQVVGSFAVIAGLALSATATALLLASVLIQIIGPRRTRVVAAVLASMIGISIFLVLQGINIFSVPLHPEISAALSWMRSAHARAIFGPYEPWAWPARAALGSGLSVIAFLGSASLYYLAAVQLVGRRFSILVSATIGSQSRHVRSLSTSVRQFRGGLKVVLVQKELRLIRRSPALLAQNLLRPLFLLPSILILVKSLSHGNAVAIGLMVGLITFSASSLAGGFAGIAASIEDAPDLIASAPVSSDDMRHAKLISALLPVAVLCSPVLAFLWFEPLASLATVFGIALGALSESLIQLWYCRPVATRKFGVRGTRSIVANVGGLLSGIGWAMTAGLIAAGSIWSILTASIAVSLVFILAINSHPAGRKSQAGA